MRWTFGSLAIVLTFGRFYIRWRYARLQWDDLFNGLALPCLISCYALQDIYWVTGNDSPSLKIFMASSMLLWTTLYLVKASFLALCWIIFNVWNKFRWAWWAVAIYTFLTFWPIVLWALWQCGSPSNYADPVACSSLTDFQNQWYEIVGGAFETALHVSSDILILVLPLAFIRKLHMSRIQKFSAASVFALVTIDIIMGLMRNITKLTYFLNDSPDLSYQIATTMQFFEPGLAVIVCALPAYRVLLPNSQKRRNQLKEPLRGAFERTPPIRRDNSTQTLDAEYAMRETETVRMV